MRLFRNSKGFTLTELMVATGVSSIVIYLIFSSVSQMKNQQTQIELSIHENIDTMLGERAMIMDLRNIDASFNNIVSIRDDKDLVFFDYFHDVASGMLSTRSRNLTLSLDKKTFPKSQKEMFFLTIADRLPGQLNVAFDPVSAYSVGPAPTDFNSPAKLDYKGLNSSSFISKQVQWWRDGQLVLLETVAKSRPPGTSSIALPARNPTFIGKVKGFDAELDTNLAKYFNPKAPWSNDILLNTPDRFLRLLPSANGGVPKVFIKPVKFVRYYLEPDETQATQKGSVLKRQYYNGSGFDKPIVISTNVLAVVFERNLVTEKKVSFSIIKMYTGKK